MREPIIAALVVLISTALTWCDCQERAERENAIGVQVYRAGKLEEAASHFRVAADVDPDCLNAHLWLGAALANSYIPGANTPANRAIAEGAITAYKKVLELQPDNLDAMKAVGSLSFNMKEFNVSKLFFQKAVALDPSDAESYYTIGVIDWTESYQARMDLRQRLGLKSDESLIGLGPCADMRAANLTNLEEGIQALSRSLELRPDYDDAMAYLNLMYRERADIQCGDVAGREADLTTADHWVDMTIQLKKRKAEQRTVRR